MNWRLQTILSGILAVLGLFVIFNPVTVVTAAGSIIPWLLLAAGVIQFASILFRPTARRRFRLVIVPIITGTLLVYAGLSMKFGDPTTVGPVSLIFVLALVLFGAGTAKLFSAMQMRRSRYFAFMLGSGIVSSVIGLIVLFNWSTVSTGLIGVVLGLELLADAVAMVALGLRERDGEEAIEARGLNPVEEAARIEATRAALAAKALAESEAAQAAAEKAASAAAFAAVHPAQTPPPEAKPGAL